MKHIFGLAILMVAGLALAVVGAQPSAATVQPIFNAYEGVSLHYGTGSESDFLRLGKLGEQGNTIEACTNGQVIDLWMYVHNSKSARQNGTDFDGPGVANNTRVRFAVNQDAPGHLHQLVATIDSDETNAISDNVSIRCRDHAIKVKYKAMTYFGSAAPTATGFDAYDLRGDMLSGALLGYQKGSRKGIVPGCWEYRSRINMQVEIVKVEPEEDEPVEDEPEEDEPVEDEPEEDEPVEDETPETPEQIVKNNDGQALALTAVLLAIGSAAVATTGHRTFASRRN